MKYLKTNEEFNINIEEISKTDFFKIIADYLKTKINELDFEKDEKDKIKSISKRLKKSCDNFRLTFFPKQKQILIDFTYTHQKVRDQIRLYKTKDYYYIQKYTAGDVENFYKTKNFDTVLKYIENIETLFATKKYNL